MIRLYVLGTLRLEDDQGGDLSEVVVQPRLMALLVYLAIARPQGPHQRDRAVGMLWGESDQERARGALRKALHRLRAAIGEDAIVSHGTEMLSVSPASIWCDALAFDQSLSGRRLREALDFYRGELLPGFFVPGADEFGRWLDEERAYYRERAVGAAWSLVEFYENDKQFTSATQLGRVVARLASTDERMLRRVLTMLARLGDRAGAADIYRTFSDRLWREYETRPSTETVQLIESIQANGLARP